MLYIYLAIGAIALIAISIYVFKIHKEKQNVGVGLEVFDSNGTKTFDSDDLTYRILGEFSTGTSNGSITNNEINNKEVWMVVTHNETTGAGQYQTAPRFTISGNTISWQFIDPASGYPSSRISYNISYGVYK
jgi:hypothetical protein